MNESTETVYSGVVSLRKLRLAMFLPDLNNLPLWGVDIGNGSIWLLLKPLLFWKGDTSELKRVYPYP